MHELPTLFSRYSRQMILDLSSLDLVCNEGGLSGAQTVVLNAKVGDEIVFTSDTVRPEAAFLFPSTFSQKSLMTDCKLPGCVSPRTSISVSSYPEAKTPATFGFVTYTACYRFISRAPGSVQEYDGSAGWRKLYDWGMINILLGVSSLLRDPIILTFWFL